MDRGRWAGIIMDNNSCPAGCTKVLVGNGWAISPFFLVPTGIERAPLPLWGLHF